MLGGGGGSGGSGGHIGAYKCTARIELSLSPEFGVERTHVRMRVGRFWQYICYSFVTGGIIFGSTRCVL